MKYPDSVVLVDPVVDGAFGQEKIGRMETVNAVVGQSTGFSTGSYQQNISADLTVYLDPEDDFVQEVHNRLEGMMLITQSDEDEEDRWYRIETVNVAKASLLDNRLDNVQADCSKANKIPSVS